MLVPDKPFEPSLVFVGKARLERLARDKHSSFLRKSVRRNKFYDTGPWYMGVGMLESKINLRCLVRMNTV